MTDMTENMRYSRRPMLKKNAISMNVVGAARIYAGFQQVEGYQEQVAPTETRDATAHMLVRKLVFTVNMVWKWSQDINVRPRGSASYKRIDHSVRAGIESTVSDITQENARDNNHFLKPVRDLCNIKHITTAMTASPAAPIALMLMDVDCITNNRSILV